MSKKIIIFIKIKNALTGNRTRASRVAGENSTTEPSVLVAEVGAIRSTRTLNYSQY